jgi:hypothetical protein
MGKRKDKSSKRVTSRKTEVRAQRNRQAIVRSAKDNLLGSVAAGPIEPPKLQDDSEQAPIVERQQVPIGENWVTSQDRLSQMIESSLPDASNQTAHVVEKQTAAMAEDRATSQGVSSQIRGFDFSLAAASMLAPQTKLIEIAHANVRLTFEFSQALAMVRSPFEFFDVIAKFTKKQAEMMLGILS